DAGSAVILLVYCCDGFGIIDAGDTYSSIRPVEIHSDRQFFSRAIQAQFRMELCTLRPRCLRMGCAHVICEAEAEERTSRYDANSECRRSHTHDNSGLFVGERHSNSARTYGRRPLDSGESLPNVEGGVHVPVADRLMALIAGCPADTSNCRIMRMDSGRVFL